MQQALKTRGLPSSHGFHIVDGSAIHHSDKAHNSRSDHLSVSVSANIPSGIVSSYYAISGLGVETYSLSIGRDDSDSDNKRSNTCSTSNFSSFKNSSCSSAK